MEGSQKRMVSKGVVVVFSVVVIGRSVWVVEVVNDSYPWCYLAAGWRAWTRFLEGCSFPGRPDASMVLLPLPPAHPSISQQLISLPEPTTKRKKARIQLLQPPQTQRSPKKRARVVSHGFLRKCHCPNAQAQSSQHNEGLESHPEALIIELNDDYSGGDLNSIVNDQKTFDKDFGLYSRAVFSKSVGLYQICETLWAAQGWTSRSGGNLHWFHLERKKIGEEVALGCSCAKKSCYHKRFMEIYGTKQFLFGAAGLAKVPRSNSENAKNQAIVIHKGLDAGWGSWACSKDKGDRCHHINKARHYLDMCQTGDPSTPAPEYSEEELAAEQSVCNKPINVARVSTVKDRLDPILYWFEWTVACTAVLDYSKGCQE
ncbi:hypothetical protein BDZ94DRAFT_1302959 [Collybia nuda]|uniref:Uncharacterized protein n=1 Tax=Collybia nuda TaxID=64659 RepID=A0A9P6CC29_9AGAR|nr:hypothetical protein BDZ94DRAFT_1302959 [Collybia nuda]